MMTIYRKKLIEVALPLEAINRASAREKSIRHGHPSTLHLWWARRPLAAARAVLFAQLVDDPSAHPERFPTEQEQERERQRLFRIIEELVIWENTTNETVLQAARDEIWKSWQTACADNASHPRAADLFDPRKLPSFHDPFAGGGAIPLEAQRLGLESYASDLNPVAVLINKAMIEIPPKFANRPPVNSQSAGKNGDGQMSLPDSWRGAHGLAEDVRYYGQWMRDEAERRIGQLYPKVEITEQMAQDRPDLKRYVGQKLTVIAWLWARTVKSPNPAFAHVDVPLASTFMLSTKAGKEAYVQPVIEKDGYRFEVKVGKPLDSVAAKNGTKLARGNFVCLMSGTPINGEYIKTSGKRKEIGARLMAIVAEGERGRVYLSPTLNHELTAQQANPSWQPQGEIATRMTGGNCTPYGLTTWGDLFTPRQLVALTTFSDLVSEAIEQARLDALAAGLSDDPTPLDKGGTGALAYAQAVGVYLAFAVDKGANYWSSLCSWHSGRDTITSTFGRQALPMVWDFAEGNPFSESSGNIVAGINQAGRLLKNAPSRFGGLSKQADAATQMISIDSIVSTDPPYYDNIGYADLSDFFYVWLRQSLRGTFPVLFSTLSVPKAEELVATAYRHGSKEKAETFFLEGMTQAMCRLAEQAHSAFPIAIYYAFKQSESETNNDGTASTGWETFLGAVIHAGFSISGTWPMQTELTGNLKKNIAALASSIVLVCRKRDPAAPIATRREFMATLKSDLPRALRDMQAGNIAPVDLAQAAIGPGMAVFTRFARVQDASGNVMSVREALALINQTLDEMLAEQEGEFDADSRWALAWFEQYGFDEGEFGVAETLSKAKNTSVQGLKDAGILSSTKGKVRLLRPQELPVDWDPASDARLTAWEMTHHLIRALNAEGETGAAHLAAAIGSKAERARDLAYRLYSICERKKRAADALGYNALAQSWGEITRLAREGAHAGPVQGVIFDAETEDEE